MEENKNIEEDRFLAKWLEGTVSDQELKNLVSGEDFNAYKKLRDGLTVLDSLERPIKNSFNEIENRINQKKKQVRSTYRWGISIAASFLVLIGLFFAFNQQDTLYTTAIAEQRTINLPDGSEVVLNALSDIEFNEKDWEDNRVLTLNGEAYFKVKKGSKFTVQTTNGSVSVLGTQFNVNNKDQYFEVICYEGKVKVTNNKNDYILNPGNSVRKINGDEAEKYTNDTLFPSWIDGESSFVSVPLKFVILELEKQYAIKISASGIDDSKIFTGSFSHKDLKIALVSVFKTMNIKYVKEENGILRLE